MNTMAAAVTGARHLRMARNGQDAAASWSDGHDAAVVVCDGCSAGGSSEVGGRLGASLVIGALAAQLRAGAPVDREDTWAAVRAAVSRALAELLERMPGDRALAIREHFLFTIVAAAATPDATAVWALGDGACWLGATRVFGPFPDNEPPYLAYDLLGDPQPATLVVVPPCDVVVATDGLVDDGHDPLAGFATRRFATHPDALRRHLAVLARTDERVDWDARRITRTPAQLQDDGAVGVILR